MTAFECSPVVTLMHFKTWKYPSNLNCSCLVYHWETECIVYCTISWFWIFNRKGWGQFYNETAGKILFVIIRDRAKIMKNFNMEKLWNWDRLNIIKFGNIENIYVIRDQGKLMKLGTGQKLWNWALCKNYEIGVHAKIWKLGTLKKLCNWRPWKKYEIGDHIKLMNT